MLRQGWTGLFEGFYRDATGRKLVKLVLRDSVESREMTVVNGYETKPCSRFVANPL